jgi:hypothetical protein
MRKDNILPGQGENHAYDDTRTRLIIVAGGSDAAGEFLRQLRDESRL